MPPTLRGHAAASAEPAADATDPPVPPLPTEAPAGEPAEGREVSPAGISDGNSDVKPAAEAKPDAEDADVDVEAIEEKGAMAPIPQAEAGGDGNGRTRKRKRVVGADEGASGEEETRVRSVGRRRLSEENPGDVVKTAKVPDGWLGDVPGPVVLSQRDKAPALTFVDSPLKVRGHKGYRTVRATHGAMTGSWYYEATVEEYTGRGAMRCGWSTRRADIETPVGFNTTGFGLRDLTGEFVTAARRSKYGEQIKVGDVVGCHIFLPSITNSQKERILAAEKRYMEYKFIANSQGKVPEDSGVNLDKGYVQFFKNGEAFGIPSHFYKNVEAKERGAAPDVGMKGGTYYPSISLYFNAVVSANFGPEFKFAMPEGARPLSEIAPPPAQPAEADAATEAVKEETTPGEPQVPADGQEALKMPSGDDVGEAKKDADKHTEVGDAKEVEDVKDSGVQTEAVEKMDFDDEMAGDEETGDVHQAPQMPNTDEVIVAEHDEEKLATMED